MYMKKLNNRLLHSLMRVVFFKLSVPYTSLIYLRNKLYDAGLLTARKLPRPTISVGNVQLGGTGKTTLVIHLLQWLEARQKSVAVLTRGYGRKTARPMLLVANQSVNGLTAEVIGDEPLLIFRAMKKGVIGIGKNRYRMGMRILKTYHPDLFLLDDALQHRKLARDLDICLVDVSRWPQMGLLFPYTHLRDVKSSLGRCHFILLTKFAGMEERARKLQEEFRNTYGVPVELGEYEISSIRPIHGNAPANIRMLKKHPVGAFCGIANPDAFFNLLEANGFQLARRQAFSDHQCYRPPGLQKLAADTRKAGARALLTTEKDAVKVRELVTDNFLEGIKIFAVGIQFKISREKQLLQMIGNLF